MASLQKLASAIYHERQGHGSMLCAQHALNSLLQGNYFTAPDLAAIARGIDHLEESYDEQSARRGSANVDDTGFFSVQVLENALNVWGLSPIRWRSEAMRPFHDEPDSQQAFILNQELHWYTVRRFGTDPGFWFNLDSNLPAPKWVGRLYLGMFLEQAEREGYSIFAIRSFEDDSTPNPLPPCVADEAASALTDTSLSDLSDPSELLEPSTASQQASSSRVEGFEDEDLELQAALQASLMDGAGADLVLPTHTLPPSRQQPSFPPGLGASGLTDPDDPVAASLARNRAMLARMQAQQAQALREGYEEEAARIDVINRARQRAEARGMQMAVDDDDGDEDDEDYEPSDFEHDHRQRNTPPIPQDDMEQTDEARWGEPLQLPPPIPRLITRPARRPSPPDIGSDQDQDLDLAAAIRASLEDDSMGNPEHSRGASTANQSATPLGQAPRESASQVEEVEAQEEVSIDEMRRKRLARFGG